MTDGFIFQHKTQLKLQQLLKYLWSPLEHTSTPCTLFTSLGKMPLDPLISSRASG